MCSGVAWVLVSLGTQIKPQIIHDLDYPPDYLSVFYDCGKVDERILILQLATSRSKKQEEAKT